MAKRVFFSFHYQDVIDFRANVVRQSWVTQEREEAGYFDASLWEDSKKKGDANIKRLIENGLDGTSVTSVLIGSDTYARRWVRYEIVSSIYRSNRVFGVHINLIKGKNSTTKLHGNNPFDYLAIEYSSNGESVNYHEWNGNRWVPYTDFAGYRLNTPNPSRAGKILKLSEMYKTHCWVTHDGYNNFSNWVGN